MRQPLTYILAGLMVLIVLAIPIAVIGAFLWVGVISNPATLKLLGAAAVVLVVGIAWVAVRDATKRTS